MQFWSYKFVCVVELKRYIQFTFTKIMQGLKQYYNYGLYYEIHLIPNTLSFHIELHDPHDLICYLWFLPK